MSSIDLRKAIPIIGTISSGKSFFVDSLLGLNILESESSITTKFVCVIQHHKNLKEPRFYQINLIEKNLDENNMMVYEGNIKGDIITGHEAIKEKIKEINRIHKDIPNDQIKYEELFYVLEIEVKNIENEELLNNYDFYDIPGLDEYIRDGKKPEETDIAPEKKKENLLKKMKYIEGLFKYFKSRVDFGVFVINAESHYANSSKEVIINVANILKPKKLRNYLIVLNKIDRQAEPKITIKNVKSIITNNIIKELNLSDNKFIPLDSRQLKHQTLMKESFENFLFFLFNQYCEKSVIPFKDGREGSDEEKKFNTNLYPFRQFLMDFLSKGKNEEQMEQYSEEAINKFDDNYDYDELNLKEIFEKIKNQENYIIKFDIDLEEEETIKTLKVLYIRFKEKDRLPFSVNVNKVYDYFKNILTDLEKAFDDDVAPPPATPISEDFKIQFENFTKKFKIFHENNKNFKIIGELNNSFEQLYNYIENQRIIYIGIFGNSSTGKSVIYNNIFGTNILTVNENECTKRGIIIEDGENIAMYLASSETKELNGIRFNVFRRGDRIAVGEPDVKEKLEQFNNKYSKDTDNGDLDYFIITVPIKFFDEMNIAPEIRRSVKFIDLPGYNTSESNSFAYTPVIESISCFLITFKASSIGSEDNAKSISIYRNLKLKSKRAVKSMNDADFIKCCLFVLNLWDKEEPTESNIKDWTNVLKRFILNDFTDSINLQSNFTYLNALLYQNYLKEYKYFFDYQYLQGEILNQYNSSNKGFSFGKKTFIKFFADTLKKKVKEIFKIKDKDIKEILSKENDKEIYEQMNILFENSFDLTGFLPKNEKDYEKYLKEISSYLSYVQKNIKTISHYQKSYIEKFFTDLSHKIEFSHNHIDNDFREHLINAIKIFNIFFNIDIDKQDKEKKEQFIKESQVYYEKLKKCLVKYDFAKAFDDFISEISLFFNKKMSSAEEILKKIIMILTKL